MAGPSASDVRAALSISNAGPSSSTHPTNAAAIIRKPSLRKPEGMPRELYQLIGPSAPTLTAQFAKPQLKQKPNLGSSAATVDGGVPGRVKWEWRTFTNSARKDGLKLGHWVKAGADPNADYQYAKYNVPLNTFVYSAEEYNRFLQDKEWTKEETDYLFELVREYDGRFYVVGDRYDYPGGSTRSLEDLKDRYYSVCRKLVRNKPWGGDEASKAQLLSSYSFDKEREVTRRRYVASLESRTPQQIAEEEALYVELKRLEQTERRFKKDRDELLRTLLGIESGLPDINPSDEDGLNAAGNLSISVNGVGGLSIDTKRRKKNGGDVDTPMSATSASASAIHISQPPKKQQTAKSIAYDLVNCIVRTDVPTNAGSNKSAHTPAYLRSFKLPTPKAAIAPKIAQLMAELQISHTRLVMPTRANSAKLEELLEAASQLIEQKKLLDKADMDIRMAKARLGNGTSESGEGSAGGGEGKATPGAMEVDEDAEGEHDEHADPNGRGQSVVSARSARGRKPARRSMSISSVDTAGAGNKKRKR
ncbi:hypothetical protein EUX98_g3846 [Antrodiella citrinella]|uniref:SWR1-complex protein 4 n=1 Tax=Antrodiella citrinella TaxID=2447956 RepID=A0A4S4MVG8_9APHY|nr:hypothetical protein EUX98_g3846 [Antrodiella citrinella]